MRTGGKAAFRSRVVHVSWPLGYGGSVSETARKRTGLWLMLCVAMFAAGCTSSAKESSSRSTSTAQPKRTTSSSSSPTTTQPATSTSTVVVAGLSLTVEPQDGMTPIYNFMSSARRSLDMTMYELSDPTAEQLLIADHDKGVRVRVLLDHDDSADPSTSLRTPAWRRRASPSPGRTIPRSSIKRRSRSMISNRPS